MQKIKFGTDGWRAIIAKDYTIENLNRVTKGTADWLHTIDKNPSVVIGYDCRFGGELFMQAAASVFIHEGVKVLLCDDFVTTPMISLGSFHFKTTAGIVITASHNPPSYNGFKIKSNYGGPALPADIDEVEKRIPDTYPSRDWDPKVFEKDGMLEWVNLDDIYFERIEKSFDIEMMRNSGLNLAYDAMYGAGQKILPRILPNAGLLHCEFNPSFHGQAPEPLDKNLQELSKFIKDSGNFAAGLANDGDADRIGMFDEKGNFVDAHHLILLLIHYLHKYKGLNGKVVVAFSTTLKIEKLCKLYNLPYEVTKVGFKYICGHMVAEDVLLGGEESGGIAVKGHIPERDGVWDGMLILEYMAKTGKTLSQLVDEIYDIVGEFKYNRLDLTVKEEEKTAILEACKNNAFDRFGKYEVKSIQTIDGYKFLLDDEAWMMIRPSGTEPLLRIYAEGRNMDIVNDILKSVQETILAEA